MAIALLAAFLASSASALPSLPGDGVALLQRSVWGSQANFRHNRFAKDRAPSFRVGDHLEFHLAGSKWLNCSVVAPGRLPDTYAIRVPALAPASRDLADVPAVSLRDPRKEVAKRAAKQQAEKRAADEKRSREAREAVLFEENEDVLMAGSGKTKGQWFPARILRKGSKPGAYDVRFKSMTIANVRQAFLKKTHDMHYDACEPAEVIGADGIWRRTKVMGPGADIGTVDIRFPGMAEIVPSIPILGLRKVAKKANKSGASVVLNSTLNASGVDVGEDSTVEVRTYEVGQRMWLQLDGGRETKPWVPCFIVGLGDNPGTYNVRVTAKIPSYDLCDVSFTRLRETQESLEAREKEEAKRKVEDEAKRRAAEKEEEEARRRREEEEARLREEEARARLEEREAERVRKKDAAVSKIQSGALYREGQDLQFNTHGSHWVNCTVKSLSLKPDMYNIIVPSFPEGLQEVAAVQAKALRSAEDIAKREEEEQKAKQRAAKEAHDKAMKRFTFAPEERVQVLTKGTNDTWAPALILEPDEKPGWYWVEVEGRRLRIHASSLRREPEHDFEEGEPAILPGLESSGCSVTGWGELPGTYNIHCERGPLGHRDRHNVKAGALHRIRYAIGQPVKVHILKGPSAGLWLPANVTDIVANMSDTYSVHVFDPLHEFNIYRMPYKLMRVDEAEADRLREELRRQKEAQQETDKLKAIKEENWRFWNAEHTFEEGESVQTVSMAGDRGNWINVTVLGNGSHNFTYDLYWKKRDIIFRGVQRKYIRKDPVSQAAKIEAAENAIKMLQEREAERRKVILASSQKAEEVHKRAVQKKWKLRWRKGFREEADLVASLGDDGVDILTPDQLEKVVNMTKTIEQGEKERVARVKSYAQQAGAFTSSAAEERPQSEDEDIAKREAEWEKALAEEESDAKEGAQPIAQESANAKPSIKEAAKPIHRSNSRESAFENIMRNVEEEVHPGIDI